MKRNKRNHSQWMRSIEKATYQKVAFHKKLITIKNSLDEIEKVLEMTLPKKHH